jgi:hypothetical protein
MNDFFSRDSARAFEEIKAELYARLQDVRTMLCLPHDGEIDAVLDQRLVNEEMWLALILDKMERS